MNLKESKMIKTMRILWIAFYAIAWLFPGENFLHAQWRQEEVDPTVPQFEVVRGSGDPNYTGALDFNIPLLKVPGRGGLEL